LGDGTDDANWNILTTSAIIGTSFSANVQNGGTFCDLAGATRRNVIGTCKDANGTPINSLNLVRFDCTCDGSAVLASCKVVGGGSGTKVGSAAIADLVGVQTCTMSGNNNGVAGTVASAARATNTFYHVAGFYDTATPKLFADALHEGVKHGELVPASGALTIMGGISGISNYYYRGKCGVNEVQMFFDLNSIGTQGAGTNRGTAATRETASVVAGKGAGLSGTQSVTDWYIEHAQKYQYAGRGFDQLTVTPAPDRMAGQKIVVTYRGAAGACSVKEVDRGTHESSVCSGRGNCDGATGTCVCDAGYTLEACSEQTVLV
jgi:hypothetical protein